MCGWGQKAYSEGDDDVRNLSDELERGECRVNKEAWHSTVRDAVRERDALRQCESAIEGEWSQWRLRSCTGVCERSRRSLS